MNPVSPCLEFVPLLGPTLVSYGGLNVTKIWQEEAQGMARRSLNKFALQKTAGDGRGCNEESSTKSRILQKTNKRRKRDFALAEAGVTDNNNAKKLWTTSRHRTASSTVDTTPCLFYNESSVHWCQRNWLEKWACIDNCACIDNKQTFFYWGGC